MHHFPLHRSYHPTSTRSPTPLSFSSDPETHPSFRQDADRSPWWCQLIGRGGLGGGGWRVLQNPSCHLGGWRQAISSQFQTWDGQGWIYFRSSGTVFGSRGIVGCSIEILGVLGDENAVLFELNFSRRFRISSVAYSLSCYLISLYIWSILWNIIYASLGSLCLDMLLLMLDTFTNHVLLFFLWLSWPSSILFTHLMTERIYWYDALGVITLVYFRAFTAIITNCISLPNVLTSMGNPWAPYISADATTNASSSELR